MSPELITKALRHLSKDPKFKILIKKFGKPDFKISDKHFEALVSSIIYQQISGKADQTIEARFRKMLKNKLVPEKVRKLKDFHFQKSGISPQKMKYIIDLSEKFINGTVNPKNFHKMTDGEITNHLVSVKGIGTWTAHMFLMFTLARPDVLPTGDLAIQKGIKSIYKMKTFPSIKKMEKLGNSWKPYRTIASWYIWKVADQDKKIREDD